MSLPPHLDRYLLIELPKEDLEALAIRTALEVYEPWSSVAPSDVRLTTFDSGWTNRLFRLQVRKPNSDKPQNVLVRIYGNDTESFIDRKVEIALMKQVGSPQIYGTFNNGYVYEFIEGEPLTAQRLRESEHLLRLSLEALASYHVKPLFGDVPPTKRDDMTSFVFRRIDDWRSLACQLMGLEDVRIPSRGASPTSLGGLSSVKSDRLRNSFREFRMGMSSSVSSGGGGGGGAMPGSSPPLHDSLPIDIVGEHHLHHSSQHEHSSPTLGGGGGGSPAPGSSPSGGSPSPVRYDGASPITLESLIRMRSASPDRPFDFEGFLQRLPRLVERTRNAIKLVVTAARRKSPRIAELALAAAVCHLDANAGNMIYAPERVALIDCEYGGVAPRALDIANYFCELAGLDCRYDECYPSRERRLHLIEMYLKCYDNAMKSKDSTSTTTLCDSTNVEALCDIVDAFVPAIHLQWATWSVLQSKVSDLPYDFQDYGRKRMEEYNKRARALVDVLKSSADADGAANLNNVDDDDDELIFN